MESKPEKKKNIFLYFLGMAFVFIVIFFVEQLLGSLISNGVLYAKYGYDALFEIIWAVLVLIVLLLFKNKYVFTQERESFSKGFKYILPEVIISIVILCSSIITLTTSNVKIDIIAILNAMLLCIFIGIVEEFMCRGWLLNEFLERYSDTKKGIWLSIIFSSLIFGLIHFLNIGDAQGFIDTLAQVLNATVCGVFLALVYYKTKNIWLVVFSHAFYDFSIFLGESNQLVDCYVNGSPTKEIITYNLVVSLIFIIGYAFLCYWMYRKTDLYENKNEKNNNKLVFFIMVIGVIIYLSGCFLIPEPKSYKEYNICPVYKEKELSTDYSWTVDLSSEYNFNFVKEINYDDITEVDSEIFNFTLTSNAKTNEVEFKNNVTDYKVQLAKDIIDYLLIENENDYIILIQNSYNTVLYGRFIKSEISNSNSYLDQIKDNLKEYHVPEITFINKLKPNDSKYTYASIKTSLNERLFFENDELFILK